MKFKKNAKPIMVMELYYDIITGIFDFEKLLIKKDAEALDNAVKTINDFINEAEEKGLLPEM